MIAPQVIQQIEAAGGVLTLDGDRIRYDVPKEVALLVDVLRQHREEVFQALQGRKEMAQRQVSCWMASRCSCPVNKRRVWASEKSLYRDYHKWSQQINQTPCLSGLFTSIMNEAFSRVEDGWQGVCLRVDFAASKGLVGKLLYRLPLATEKIQ